MIIKESIESELELVNGLKRGDEQSKSKFIKEYYPILFQYISVNFGRKLSKHEISDIATDGILRAIQKIDKFTFKASIKNWLITIASRTFYDFNRKMTLAKHSIVPNSYELSDTPYEDDILKIREDKDFITKFKDTLSPLENSYLDLFLKGYNHREIAEIMNGTESVSKWHKSNLINKLTNWSKAGEPTIKTKGRTKKVDKSERKLKTTKGLSKPIPVKIKNFLDYLENKRKKRED